MRLLNTANLELEYFADDEVPTYAILSHTWGKASEEVTFEDIKSGTATAKAAYQKLVRSSEIAARDDISHVWIDTCCINKSSK
jgi:hypothetical protein